MQQFKLRKTALYVSTAMSAAIILSGCSNQLMNPDLNNQAEQVRLDNSFLYEEGSTQKAEESVKAQKSTELSEFTRLNSLSNNPQGLKLEVDLSAQFGNDKIYQASVNELPLNDFIHYALGELLNVSYLIEPSVKSNIKPVTLELKEKISAQRLFQLIQQVLAQHDIAINLNDDVFYVYPLSKQGNKTNTAFGFGRNASDVPAVSSDIIQLVPLRYGSGSGLKSTISALVDAKIDVDARQGLVTITGSREQVLRALSLINLLDSKEINNKSIALLSFKYINSQTFIEKVTLLLAEEGIHSKESLSVSSSVKFVSLEHLGKVVVFASADEILDRVEYWSKQLDQPAKGAEQSFYTYHPRYARAADLGESLAPLIGGSSANISRQTTNGRGQSQSTQTNIQTNGQSNQSNNGVNTVEGDNMRLVVDERSNTLIFYSTGQFYQELQPIIRNLDVMPKQVMLEVVIAEVKLTGSFSKGVEFAIQSGGFGDDKTTTASFGSEDGFNYSIVGLNGSFNVNLNQTDGLINVLSRPTLLVRDGVSASISVGDDIPTVGSTTMDPDGERQTTSVQYRRTGIDLLVTPTVNAQGTVIMTIEQNISNLSAASGISGTPAFFERKISTEVVAGHAQTVMLGGLISDNKSSGSSSVPWLGSIPVIGHLFRSDSDSSDRTELVILVTPKIINDVSEWQKIQDSFTKGLQNLTF